MAEKPTFRPLQSAHSIERCAATIYFSEQLPERLFQTLVGELEKAPPDGFSRMAMVMFKIDTATGKVVQDSAAAPTGPVNFVSTDQQTNFFIAPSAISWSTQRYARWEPFVGHLGGLFGPIFGKILEALKLQGVRLEYWDRFLWGGDWNTLDISQLLDATSPFLTEVFLRASSQRHSHNGWFERVDNNRRLTNINVDILDFVEGGAQARPAVGIHTLMQDEFNIPGYGDTPASALDEKTIRETLDDLHDQLKRLLGATITREMSNTISLFG